MAIICLLLPSIVLAQSADYVVNSDLEASISSYETVSEEAVTPVVSTAKGDGSKSMDVPDSDSKKIERGKKLSTAATGDSKNGNPKKGGVADTIGVFLKMIFVLAIVLAIIWIIFKLLQRGTGASSAADDKFLRKVASLSISPGKSVQVVTLVDRAFLIGVADNSVNLLCELDDPELISAMNLYAEKKSPSSKPKNFSEVLEIFMPRKKSSGPAKNVFDDGAAQQILNSIKKQSDRMNRGE